jgi:Tol biopolymer transport system component
MKQFRLSSLIVVLVIVAAACASAGETPSTPISPGVEPHPELTATLAGTSTPTTVASPTLISEDQLATGEPAETLLPTSSPTDTQQASSPMEWIAFSGLDGNIWLLERTSGERKQVTQDANPTQPGTPSDQPVIDYCCAKWSTDGNLLAFQQEKGFPDPKSGYEYQFSLWVYDFRSQQAKSLLENQMVAGFAWKPGEHILTYGLNIPTEFFLNQSPELARGIQSLDVDSGKEQELVAPENGLPLVNPVWSDDGKIMAFEEIMAMEGRGRFAYFDFEMNQYISWEQVVGSYTLSPHAERVAYDRLAYIPTGGERIWINTLNGDDEQPLSPDYAPGYAFSPVFSPTADRVAYLVDESSDTGVGTPEYNLFILDVSTGQAQNLGAFEQATNLSWSLDGSRLLLTAGPYPVRQVVEVVVETAEALVLVDGSQPDRR